MAVEHHRHQDGRDAVRGSEKGANWPRAISCASRSGLLPSSGLRDVTPSDLPSGRRAEIIRL